MPQITFEDIRQDFPITNVCTFLESAYHGPFPASGARAMSEYVERWSVGPYPDGRVHKWLEQAETVRGKVSKLLNVTPEEILFTRSTTDGLHLIASSLLNPGDEILVGGLDHPANYTTWMHLANRGIKVTLVPHRGEGMSPEDIASAISPKTRAVGMCLVNTYNGYREDLKSLSEICSEHGLFLMLDGIKALGQLNVDLQAANVTVISAGVYKFLCSPEGLGIAYVNKQVLNEIRPGTPHLYHVTPKSNTSQKGFGWGKFSGWGNYTDQFHKWGDEGAGPHTLKPNSIEYPPNTKRLETSMNHLALIGLESMVDLLINVGGMESVEHKVLELSAYLRESVQEHGHTVLSSQARENWSGTTLIEVPDADKFVSYCEDRGVYVRPGSSLLGDKPGIRVSPHVFNNNDDIDKLTEALDSFKA